MATVKPSLMKRVVDELALKGFGEMFKPSTWNFKKQFQNAAVNPEEFVVRWNAISLATAIWLQVVTSTLNPILMFFQYKKDKDMAPSERRMLITQEAAKQFVHLCLHVGVMLIGVKFAKKAIEKIAMQVVKDSPETAKALLKTGTSVTNGTGELKSEFIGPIKTYASNIGGCFAGAILLPILGATLFKQLDKKMGLTGEKAHGKSHEEVKKSEQELKRALSEISRFDEVSYAPAVIPHTITYHQNPVVHPNHPVHLQGSTTTAMAEAPVQPQPAFGSKNPFGTRPKMQQPSAFGTYPTYSSVRPLSLR